MLEWRSRPFPKFSEVRRKLKCSPAMIRGVVSPTATHNKELRTSSKAPQPSIPSPSSLSQSCSLVRGQDGTDRLDIGLAGQGPSPAHDCRKLDIYAKEQGSGFSLSQGWHRCPAPQVVMPALLSAPAACSCQGHCPWDSGYLCPQQCLSGAPGPRADPWLCQCKGLGQTPG